MAGAGYSCMWESCANPVNHLLTTMNTGATVPLCDEHYAPVLIYITADELGLDGTALYKAVERHMAREAKQADKALADAQAAAAAEGSQDPAASPQPGPPDDARNRRSDDAKATADDEHEEIYP